ncbi:MAG: 50S ribosomal protein L4 [bacterium]|nr:50S ribosomal protein L4 [bacterium]
MKTDVHNLDGKVVGSVDLPDRVFAYPWNSDLVHQALQTQAANKRLPWAHAKDRSEVRGGGRKPWKQKGTGRARHGSIRSPIWIGGGTTHGPLKSRDYTKKINKKMLRAAIYSSISKKLSDQEITVIDSLDFKTPKTKEVVKSLKSLFKKPFGSVLIIPAKDNKLVYRISRNIPKVKSLHPESLNVREILQYKNILIDQKAVTEIK